MSPVNQPDNNTRSSNVYETSVVKSKAKNKKGLKGGGETYYFEETFNTTVESLTKSSSASESLKK
jgi:hypothetical protein